jgi:hypothetical protein
MLNRRHLALLVTGACLLLASGAGAAPVDNKFTAESTPSHVKPAVSTSYTVTLTNAPSPSGEADAATITAPEGFGIDEGPVTATTSANPESSCVPATWVPAVVPAARTINLTRPGGSANNLCPGEKLTVAFSAKSAAGDGVYAWVTQLLHGADPPFTLIGSQPTVRVDGTAPAVAITEQPSNPSNSNSAGFAFTVSEAAALVCMLDGVAVAPCGSPKQLFGLGDGVHTFLVAATDPAGNAGQASYTWRVETRAPTAAVASAPAALTNSRSATFVFSADEPASFHCRLDESALTPCNSPASFQGLGDGAHTFVVRPTDAVGNIGTAASRTWRIDATSPQTTLRSAPRGRTTSLSARFTFSANEAAGFECKLDSGAFARCTSPKRYASLRRRAHSFQVRAIDQARNVDPTPAVRRWTIASSRTARTASALLAPAAGARVSSPPLLAWRPAPRAVYYNVQLYRGAVKVLSIWPTRSHLQLRTRWSYLGRERRLVPGTYRWLVWPRYGRGAAGRYGALLGQSTFTVTARR